MSENAFGEDRTGEPGINMIPGSVLPPQFTDFMVESCAIHSQSQGWLPGVVIRALTSDTAGITGCLVVDDSYWEFVDSLIQAGKRAPLDVDAGRRDGTLT